MAPIIIYTSYRHQNLPHGLCDLSSLPLHDNSINYFWIMYYIPLSNVRKSQVQIGQCRSRPASRFWNRWRRTAGDVACETLDMGNTPKNKKCVAAQRTFMPLSISLCSLFIDPFLSTGPAPPRSASAPPAKHCAALQNLSLQTLRRICRNLHRD